MIQSQEALYRFAASCGYDKHGYLGVQGDKLVLTDKKETPLYLVVNKALALVKTSTPEQKPLLIKSLSIIRSDLHHKIHHSWNIFYDRAGMRRAITQIDAVLNAEKTAPKTNSEEVFRLKFLASLPENLRVKQAPVQHNENIVKWRDNTLEKKIVDEWKVIEWLSKRVYESSPVQSVPEDKRFVKYAEIMKGAYKGDHLLIEEDENHHQTTTLVNLGAIIRGSSHYEKGRPLKEWDKDTGEAVFGGEMHGDLLKSEVHHYGITGNHVKHILFNAVDMSEVEGKLVPGKTTRQVEHLVNVKGQAILNGIKVDSEKVKNQRKRHFIALQFESSPDCEGFNWKDPLFWKHRVLGFITYRLMKKIRGNEHANVGPYGYGRTDIKPVVLEKAK